MNCAWCGRPIERPNHALVLLSSPSPGITDSYTVALCEECHRQLLERIRPRIAEADLDLPYCYDLAEVAWEADGR